LSDVRTHGGPLPPLRIWLEPGYDGGRHGVWLLDLPGAFSWGTTRALAVSQASVGLGRFRDWLARHGEPMSALFGRATVVEEVAATVVGGYERNATFEADRAPLAVDELETAIRRLGYARADLLTLADRVATFEAGGGVLAGGVGRDASERNESGQGRTSDGVLRHLAVAEMWLAGRLDGARFDDADSNGEVRVLLDVTRDWAVARLRRLGATAAGAERVDGKGESWTLRKVARRMLYHTLDHYRELDLRLARAEGRVDRLRFARDLLEDVAPLVRLLRSVGWDRRTADVDRLGRALERSILMVTAWDGDELVGFTRELGDGVFGSSVAMVVVDPRWQGLGVAERLIRMVIEGRDDIRFTLGAAPGLEPFYERLGFQMDTSAMVRRPRD
jgi:GNAT superfamily N-acetyltransferase